MSHTDQVETVKKIEKFPAWDTGASLPHLIQSEHRTFLIYYNRRKPDPDWNGVPIMVDPNSEDRASLTVVDWVSCQGALFGYPNDEGLGTHRLWDKGLKDIIYSAGVVHNSSWVNELGLKNVNHYLLLFHDSTFECLADSYELVSVNMVFMDLMKLLLHNLDTSKKITEILG